MPCAAILEQKRLKAYCSFMPSQVVILYQHFAIKEIKTAQSCQQPPSVAPNQGAVESANASDLVSPAQHCAVENTSRTSNVVPSKSQTARQTSWKQFYFFLYSRWY